MVLEATVICMDNSEWMRNGDYPPSRFQAQSDAVNLICGAKTQSNPENTVGVLTMAGKGRVLVTPTADLGKILSSLHGVEVNGETNLVAGVQKAQLALKHRQNKNQRQRIVLFSGSPVTTDQDTLIQIGKKLKKNNVALDIVSFGDEDESKSSKLEAFLAAVNSNDNSHLVHIPSGPSILSDVLINSPIFTGDGEGSGFAAAAAAGAAAAAAAGGAGGDFDFGVDANLDPELALALRVSLEEERARQEAAAKRAAEESAAATAATAPGSAAQEEKKEADPSTLAVNHTLSDSNPENSSFAVSRSTFEDLQPMDDESTLLEQAIAMSMADASASSANASQYLQSTIKDSTMTDTSATDDLTAALQLSLNESNSSASATDANFTSMFSDQAFVNSILSSLPGVDPNDPSIRSAIEELQHSGENKDPEKPGDEKKEEPK